MGGYHVIARSQVGLEGKIGNKIGGLFVRIWWKHLLKSCFGNNLKEFLLAEALGNIQFPSHYPLGYLNFQFQNCADPFVRGPVKRTYHQFRVVF